MFGMLRCVFKTINYLFNFLLVFYYKQLSDFMYVLLQSLEPLISVPYGTMG